MTDGAAPLRVARAARLSTGTGAGAPEAALEPFWRRLVGGESPGVASCCGQQERRRRLVRRASTAQPPQGCGGQHAARQPSRPSLHRRQQRGLPPAGEALQEAQGEEADEEEPDEATCATLAASAMSAGLRPDAGRSPREMAASSATAITSATTPLRSPSGHSTASALGNTFVMASSPAMVAPAAPTDSARARPARTDGGAIQPGAAQRGHNPPARHCEHDGRPHAPHGCCAASCG